MTRRPASLIAVLALAGVVATGLPAASGQGASCASGRPGGEWPFYGRNYKNNRYQAQERKIGPLQAASLDAAWVFSSQDAGGSGDFTGTPVVADGCVYVASNDGWVFAVNAETGAPVWKTELPGDGGVNSSVAVRGGRVFTSISDVSAPAVAALDQATGRVLWKTVIDTQPGSDTYSSPVPFEGVVFAGVSGGSAELGDEADRYRFQGAFVLLDVVDGSILKKTWTIRPPDDDVNKPKNDYAGAAVWATPAVDPDTKTAYVGAGNPFRPQAEHPHSNAILKIDLDRDSPTFGKIVDSYKGTVDEYFPGINELPCFDIPGNPPPYYPQGGGACTDLDMDFGSSPNLFRSGGRLLIGEGQKSGVYHAADARTMKGEWTALLGPPSAVGGIVGSTAYDGQNVYGPIVPAGYLWSVGKTSGLQRWFAPVGDGAHWGNPTAVANDVVYTADLRGFLDAYHAQTGTPLLHRPMKLDVPGPDPIVSWGGVSIARHTVYAAVGITGLSNGFVIAYRPSL